MRTSLPVKMDLTFEKRKLQAIEEDLTDFDREKTSAYDKSTEGDVIELAERLFMETDRPFLHSTPET
jgi:hypothetical protein